MSRNYDSQYRPPGSAAPYGKLAVAAGGLLLVAGSGVGFWLGSANAPARKPAPQPVAVAQAPPAANPTKAPAPVTPAPVTPPAEVPDPPTKPEPKVKLPDPKPVPKPADEPKPEMKKPAPAAPAAVEFSAVGAIFKAKCVSCHGGGTKKGGLALDSLAALKAGGDGGQEVTAGNLEKSWLWLQVDGDAMPPDGKEKLTAAEKKTVRDWILGGAK